MFHSGRGSTAHPDLRTSVTWCAPDTQSLVTMVVRPHAYDRNAICARLFTPADAEGWEELVQRSANGTFLHSQRFLSYHGDRFRDCSVVFTTARGAIVGVLPAALDPGDDRTVVSHPGATYGGIVHDGTLRGHQMAYAIEGAAELFRLQGKRKLRYRVVPYIYHRIPAQDDVYWLHRLGAIRHDFGLAATVDVERRPMRTLRRGQKVRKASRAGIVIGECTDLRSFWSVVENNLMDRHGVRPVHSLQEIELLAGRFPDQIKCLVARLGDDIIAGSLFFMTDTVVHAQYNATSHRGRQLSGLDLVVEHCIELTGRLGRRYYDFGISTEKHGTVLNEGLQQYKTSFGAGSCTYESYELPLPEAGRSI